MLKPLPKLTQITPALPAPPPTGGVPKKSKEWQSAGVRQKPASCELCAYSQVGAAFVADYIPAAPKIAYIFKHPRKDDIAEQKPLSGPWGATMRRLLITDLGREENSVALIHTLRCMPRKIQTRNGPAYQYPTGYMQRQAENNCRQYDNSAFREGLLSDGGLIDWGLDMFVATLDVDTLLEVGAYKYMIQEDVKKAWGLVDEGRRIAVLFGSEVLSLVAGHLSGGSKRWRGHLWSASWPFEAKVRKEGFR